MARGWAVLFLSFWTFEVWTIGWLGLFSSTWIGLRVLVEMGFCCGVETKSELGYWGLPAQIGGCGGLVPQLDHRLRKDGQQRHLQQIEDQLSAVATRLGQ